MGRGIGLGFISLRARWGKAAQLKKQHSTGLRQEKSQEMVHTTRKLQEDHRLADT